RVQIEGERVGSRQDHESFVAHVTSSAYLCRRLKKVSAPRVAVGGPLRPRLSSTSPRPRGHNLALLAQSAEHSHGKAGVVGLIPTEGSPPSRRGGIWSRAERRGDSSNTVAFVR